MAASSVTSHYDFRNNTNLKATAGKVGKVSWDLVRKIAEDKMSDLNCFTIDSAMRMVAGTARSMGLKVEGGTAPQ